MKVCSKCGVEKDEGEYYFNGDGKYRAQCKICKNIKNKEYCQKNKEKMDIYYKKYYQENKEKLKNYNKEFYIVNKEIISVKAKKYYQNNKKTLNIQHRKWAKDNKEKMDIYYKKYREDNKESLAIKQKEIHKAITDGYLYRVMNIPTSINIPKEFLEFKRLLIKFKRELKK